MMNRTQMRRWRELKEMHPEALLLFRDGENYTSWKEDAVRLSEICGLPSVEDDNGVTTSFNHDKLDTYIPVIIRKGCRVAICN